MSAQGGGRRNSVATLQRLRDADERFALITAYDRATAELAEAAELPAILVGDSLAQVALGHESTVRIGMSEMLHHVAAVVRSSRSALVIADMPFLSYVDLPTAAASASAFLRDAGAGAVKLEGGTEMAPIVGALVESGVPVIGHIGFTPQSALQQDRARAEGKEPAAAAQLLADALALQAAGAAAIVGPGAGGARSSRTPCRPGAAPCGGLRHAARSGSRWADRVARRRRRGNVSRHGPEPLRE